jgi:transcription elongation GreA/GreB family factor
MTRNPPRSDRAWRPWRWSEVEDWAVFTQEGGNNQVEVGSTVRIRDAWGEEEHTLVTPTQSDAAGGRISIESPVGSALLGRRRGDRIEVQTPGGLRVLSIVDVAGPESELDHGSSGPCRP